MKNHVKIYLKHYNLSINDFIECKVCSRKATDIHHIDARGMGGSKQMDNINNLIALCRECHLQYGDKKQYKDFLRSKIS